jgi:hypothetical protein
MAPQFLLRELVANPNPSGPTLTIHEGGGRMPRNLFVLYKVFICALSEQTAEKLGVSGFRVRARLYSSVKKSLEPVF